MIVYDFPPIKAISSFRNYFISTQFIKYFKRVDVITTSNRRYLPKEKFPLDHIDVIEVPTLDYRTIFHSDKTSGVNIDNTPGKDILRKMKNSFPFNLLIGLGGIVYILIGTCIAFVRVKKLNITHVFSSFRPYANHLIAYFLKKRFPTLIWIADFNNPHYLADSNNIIWRPLQRWCNRKLLSNADVVSVVSDGMVVHLQEFNDNVIVLENGIYHESLDANEQPSKKFTLSYTGSLYPEQSMHLMWRSLNELIEEGTVIRDDICINYAGASSRLWQKCMKGYDLLDVYNDQGVISIEAARQLQTSSHINLLLSWTTSTLQNIIPAKFYEYLVANSPILFLINGTKDILWEQKFKTLNAGKIFYEKEEDRIALKEFIQNLYREWKSSGIIDFQFNQEEVKKYHWDYQMREFMKKLNIVGVEDD